MTATTTTARATYRIRTQATGRNFAHFATVKIAGGRRVMHSTENYATPAAAIAAAESWVARHG